MIYIIRIIDNSNIKIHYLIRKNKKDPKILIKLYKICKEFRPHIIHSWDSMASVYAVPIAKKLKIKLVNGMIRDAPSKLKPLSKVWIRSKITFPFSDIIVSNSFAGIKSYNPPANKWVCIHNGFDTQRVDICKNKKDLKIKFDINSDKIVGMVASFSNNKDYATYISSARMILDKRNDVSFLAIGDGVNLEKFKKLVNIDLYGKIKFLGKQKHVEPIIDLFDIGVLATYSEGLSNAIMEYMALSKPVVATDSGGTKELVLNGKTGFLVRPCNDIDLCDRINRLLEDNCLAQSMGTVGKERIFKHFSLSKMTNSYVSLYNKIIRQSPNTFR